MTTLKSVILLKGNEPWWISALSYKPNNFRQLKLILLILSIT